MRACRARSASARGARVPVATRDRRAHVCGCACVTGQGRATVRSDRSLLQNICYIDYNSIHRTQPGHCSESRIYVRDVSRAPRGYSYGVRPVQQPVSVGHVSIVARDDGRGNDRGRSAYTAVLVRTSASPSGNRCAVFLSVRLYGRRFTDLDRP